MKAAPMRCAGHVSGYVSNAATKQWRSRQKESLATTTRTCPSKSKLVKGDAPVEARDDAERGVSDVQRRRDLSNHHAELPMTHLHVRKVVAHEGDRAGHYVN